MADRVFVRDDFSNPVLARYINYLGEHKRSLWDLDYDGALWWSYLMEQYGRERDEPQVGVDFLQTVWRITDDSDPSVYDTIQLAINEHDRVTGPDNVSVEDLFHDFSIAGAVQANPATFRPSAGVTSPERYGFADLYVYHDFLDTYEWTHYGGNYRVTLGKDNVGVTGAWSGREETGIWDTQYLKFWVSDMLGIESDTDRNAESRRALLAGDPPYMINFHGETDPYNHASYTVLAYKGEHVERMWTTGTAGLTIDNSFSVSLMQDSDAPYDLIVAVVTGWVGAGWPARVGFEYTFDHGRPTVTILDPTSTYPAYIGLPEAPERFLVRLQVSGPPELGGTTVEGLTARDFRAYVGSPAPINQAEVHLAAYVLGEYWLTIEPPVKGLPGAGPYNLTVDLGGVMATSVSSVFYEEKKLDQVLTIDRSVSMTGQRIKAAKSAAQLYVDVSATGEQLGVVSFNGDEVEPNDDAELVYPLTPMDSDWERGLVRLAIDGLVLDGFTSIGDGLRAALSEFSGAGTDAENWIILLSDGRENEALNNADVKESLLAEGIRVMCVALSSHSD